MSKPTDMTKPYIEKAGSIWWVETTETYRGMDVQRSRPCKTWDEALEFALILVARQRSAA